MKLVCLFFLFTFSCSAFSADGDSYDQRLDKAQLCTQKERAKCLSRHNYRALERKFYEVFEYQFLNRQNELQVYYNRCVVRAYERCYRKYDLEKAANNFRDLRKRSNDQELLESIRNNTLRGEVKKQVKKIAIPLEKIKRAKKIVQNILSSKNIKKATHGIGAGFDLSVFAGVGLDLIKGEVVVHNGKIGVFCSPGIDLSTDIGVAAELSLIKTNGCYSNQIYGGGFISASISGSLEALALPVSIGADYSVGMRVNKFLKELRSKMSKERFDIMGLKQDLIRLNQKRASSLAKVYGEGSFLEVHFLLNHFTGSLFQIKTNISRWIEKELRDNPNGIKRLITYLKRPYGSLLKSSIKKILKRKGIQEYSHLKEFLISFENNLTGCDSKGIRGGLSLSLSPLSVGVGLNKYHLISELDLGVMKYLAEVFSKPWDVRNINPSKFTKAIEHLFQAYPKAGTVYQKCVRESVDEFQEDYKSLKYLL